MTQQEANRRVAVGAALLDRKQPGWADRVSVERLYLHDGCRCVLGQLFGSFTFGVRRLWPIQALFQTGDRLATAHGFLFLATLEHPYVREEYHLLTTAWAHEIALRKPVQWTHRAVDQRALQAAE